MSAFQWLLLSSQVAVVGIVGFVGWLICQARKQDMEVILKEREEAANSRKLILEGQSIITAWIRVTADDASKAKAQGTQVQARIAEVKKDVGDVKEDVSKLPDAVANKVHEQNAGESSGILKIG